MFAWADAKFGPGVSNKRCILTTITCSTANYLHTVSHEAKFNVDAAALHGFLENPQDRREAAKDREPSALDPYKATPVFWERRCLFGKVSFRNVPWKPTSSPTAPPSAPARMAGLNRFSSASGSGAGSHG